MNMRLSKTITRILLTLSAINFAFAAPVTLGRIHEVRVDVTDVSKDGTVTSQKLWDLSGERSMNVADWMSAPLIPRSSDSDHWLEGPHNARSPGDSDDPGTSNPQPLN